MLTFFIYFEWGKELAELACVLLVCFLLIFFSLPFYGFYIVLLNKAVNSGMNKFHSGSLTLAARMHLKGLQCSSETGLQMELREKGKSSNQK